MYDRFDIRLDHLQALILKREDGSDMARQDNELLSFLFSVHFIVFIFISWKLQSSNEILRVFYSFHIMYGFPDQSL